KTPEEHVVAVVAVCVPGYPRRAFAVHRNVGIPLIRSIVAHRVCLRPFAGVQILEEDVAAMIPEALPDQPDPAAGIALQAVIDVRTGLAGETLHRTPGVPFEANGEQIPIHALGIAGRVIDLLRPDEP